MDRTSGSVTVVFSGFPRNLSLRTGPGGRVASPASERRTVKHIAEAAGLPHTELGSAEVGGVPVGMDYVPSPGEVITLFPKKPPARGGPPPAFLLDVHLGRLARLLRLLGFDVWYRNDLEDEAIVKAAAAEGRTILTRDRRLLMRKAVTAGRLVRSDDPETQAADLIADLGLERAMKPASRCAACGRLLGRVDKSLVSEALPDAVRRRYRKFFRCPGCGAVYWRGDHFRNIEPLLKRLRAELKERRPARAKPSRT